MSDVTKDELLWLDFELTGRDITDGFLVQGNRNTVATTRSMTYVNLIINYVS